MQNEIIVDRPRVYNFNEKMYSFSYNWIKISVNPDFSVFLPFRSPERKARRICETISGKVNN